MKSFTMRFFLCAISLTLALLLSACVTQPTAPKVEINADGYWVINGNTTDIKAVGTDGTNGKDGANGKDGNDGKTPTIEINSDGFWVINGVVTNVNAEGKVTDENPQGLDFYLQDDGTYAVAIGNAKELSHIEIPESYKGKSVTAIAKYGFCPGDSESSLVSIVLPDTVTEIGRFAFANCGLLEDVALGNGVKAIDKSAFSYCESLKSITITDNVTDIEDEVFFGCKNLLSVKLGKSVQSIGNSSFTQCDRLIEVYDLSDSLEIEKGSTENGGLGYCAMDVYTSNDIPSKIYTDNNGFVFYESADVVILKFYLGKDTHLILPNGYDGKAYKLADKLFYDADISSIVISRDVTAIGKSVFNNTLENIYYAGSGEEWTNVTVDSSNVTLPYFIKFYSEIKPTEKLSSYWHYENGLPTVWMESN